MKRVSILFIIMLLAISHGYADTDQADYWDKVRQMDEMAERFKAETGFTGSISYDLNRMCFGSYEGNFAGIQITAEADTASFRSAFEQILDKVLPYTFAKREQLVRSRITNMSGIIVTDYYQQVNGYRVEGIGRLSIAYEVGRNAFAIGNGTVELPEGDVIAIITPEQAEEIALRDMNDERYSISKVFDLAFSSEGSETYYLAYFVVVSSVIDGDLDLYTYWIDAQTGLVRKSCVAPRYKSDMGSLY